MIRTATPRQMRDNIIAVHMKNYEIIFGRDFPKGASPLKEIFLLVEAVYFSSRGYCRSLECIWNGSGSLLREQWLRAASILIHRQTNLVCPPIEYACVNI